MCMIKKARGFDYLELGGIHVGENEGCKMSVKQV